MGRDHHLPFLFGAVMQFDESLQWCVDNKAAFTFTYVDDVDGNKLWTARVSRGIISAQYQFSTPEEMPNAFWMACYAVIHGTLTTQKMNLTAMLEKAGALRVQSPAIQPPLQQGEVLCDRCDARCCKYVCIALEKPVTKEDFDWLRFYVMHKNSYITLDVTGQWALVFDTPCSFLEGNECGIHDDTRPSACLEMKPPYCDYTSSPESFIRFDTPEQLEAYATLQRGQNETV